MHIHGGLRIVILTILLAVKTKQEINLILSTLRDIVDYNAIIYGFYDNLHS